MKIGYRYLVAQGIILAGLAIAMQFKNLSCRYKTYALCVFLQLTANFLISDFVHVLIVIVSGGSRDEYNFS